MSRLIAEDIKFLLHIFCFINLRVLFEIKSETLSLKSCIQECLNISVLDNRYVVRGKTAVKVFRYSFLGTIPHFYNQLLDSLHLVRTT